MEENNIKKYSLILQGGAEYGVCYLGLIDAMFDVNMFPALKQTIGTSIGSLFALYISIISSRAVHEKTDSSGSINDLFETNIFLAIINALTQGGFYDIYSIINQYNSLIEDITGIKNPTLMQCYNINKIACTLVSFDLKSKRPVYFNTFTNPNMRVIDCIAASCNIPILCKPIYIDDYALVDGGLIKNLDFSITDRNGVIDEFTISVNLVSPLNNRTDSVIYIIETLFTLADINEIKQNVSDNQNRNIISIQTLTKKIILSPEERRLEKVNAYEISKEVLSLVDFSMQ